MNYSSVPVFMTKCVLPGLDRCATCSTLYSQIKHVLLLLLLSGCTRPSSCFKVWRCGRSGHVSPPPPYYKLSQVMRQIGTSPHPCDDIITSDRTLQCSGLRTLLPQVTAAAGVVFIVRYSVQQQRIVKSLIINL